MALRDTDIICTDELLVNGLGKQPGSPNSEASGPNDSYL
jgi:hypothetical protein